MVDFDRADLYMTWHLTILTNENTATTLYLVLIRNLIKSMINSNYFPGIINNLKQFVYLETTLSKFISDSITNLNYFSYLFLGSQIVITFIFAFHIFLFIVLLISISFYFFFNVISLKVLYNICWSILLLLIFIGFLFSAALVIACLLLQDTCNLFTYDILNSSTMSQIMGKDFNNGTYIINVCAYGDGNFAYLEGFNPTLQTQLSNLNTYLINISPYITYGFLITLETRIGKRVDHCCLNGIYNQFRDNECSGFFAYQYIYPEQSMLETINSNLHTGCTSGSRFQIVFFHTTLANDYSDCPSGYTYSNSNPLPSTGNVCVTVGDYWNGAFPFSQLGSSCNAVTYNFILNYLNYMKTNFYTTTQANIAGSKNYFCYKLYNGGTYAVNQNKFYLFKLANYPVDSPCSYQIVMDIYNIIKNYQTNIQAILTYFNSGISNCLIVKEVIYRINSALCSNFQPITNMTFLMMILITSLDIFALLFVSLMNRMMRNQRITPDAQHLTNSDKFNPEMNSTERMFAAQKLNPSTKGIIKNINPFS